MASKNGSLTDEVADLLRKLLIVQLGLAGVSQQNIRAIVGCNLNRVNAVMKLVNTKGEKTKSRRG